jgi:protocatechuate 3,4-dioxygenase beta subunit
MKRMLQTGFFALLLTALTACNGQSNPAPQPQQTNKLVGGGCDGCELMFVGMPEKIDDVDTSAGWTEEGQKLLVTGRVYKQDGKTPAPNVVIYYWQTDNKGYYAPGDGMDERAKRHGHIRGWVKTTTAGLYAIYTIRPAPYPDADIPAHIHTAIKEPSIANEYYIDEFVFDNDPLLTSAKRKALQNRGGSGILGVVLSNGMQIANHDIILGRNIPAYPQTPAK